MARTRKRSETASTPESQHSVGIEDRPSENAGMIDPRERVAARAYELYLQRGGSDGQDFDDWLAAERELGLTSNGGSEPESGE